MRKTAHVRTPKAGGNPVWRAVKLVYFAIKGFADEFLTNNCPYLAAAISFYALLSFFPLTLALISISGFLLKTSPHAELAGQVAGVLPVSQGFFSSTLKGIVRARQFTSVAAILGLFWASTAVFTAVRKGINTAWGVRRPRTFFKERLIDLGLTAGAGFLIILVLASTSSLDFFEALSPYLPPQSAFARETFWQGASQSLPPVMSFLVFVGLYRLLPNTRVRLVAVLPGALLAALGFELVRNFFIDNVYGISQYSIIYGSIGGLVALLSWIYLSALILLLGAALCAKLDMLLTRIAPLGLHRQPPYAKESSPVPTAMED